MCAKSPQNPHVPWDKNSALMINGGFKTSPHSAELTDSPGWGENPPDCSPSQKGRDVDNLNEFGCCLFKAGYPGGLIWGPRSPQKQSRSYACSLWLAFQQMPFHNIQEPQQPARRYSCPAQCPPAANSSTGQPGLQDNMHHQCFKSTEAGLHHCLPTCAWPDVKVFPCEDVSCCCLPKYL